MDNEFIIRLYLGNPPGKAAWRQVGCSGLMSHLCKLWCLLQCKGHRDGQRADYFANADGHGVGVKSARLWQRPSRLERSLQMSPGAPRFAPDRSIGSTRRCPAPERAFSEVMIATIDDTRSDRAVLSHAAAIEIEFAGTVRVRITGLTPPELAAAMVRALRR